MVAVIDNSTFHQLSFLGPHPRVAVAGLGQTGVSVVRYLHRLGVECLVTDSRHHPPGLGQVEGLEGVSVYTGELRPDVLNWATHMVVSPGLPLSAPEIRSALEHGVALLSDIDLFASAAQAPVVAITGSNGKSTVTCLVEDMARCAGVKARAGGNLGTPALDLLDPECQLYILELSSFQLERTRRLRPLAGAVLNVSPDHLDRHPDLLAYATTKFRLLNWSRIRVGNLDDPLVRRSVASNGHGDGMSRISLPGSGDQRMGEAETVWFSVKSEARYSLVKRGGQEWLACEGEPLLEAGEVALSGRHNLANALAALALAEAADIGLEPAVTALQRFRGLPHRMQVVAEIDDVSWINDSKGTNVGATEAAITGLEGPLILLAGGDGKGADFTCLRQSVAAKVKVAILFGRDRQRLAEALSPVTETVMVENLEAAMALARRRASAGDKVLLSPACASLDQFENYQVRGERFESLVRQWQSR